jgi:AmmeMemoRadiSam system protein B
MTVRPPAVSGSFYPAEAQELTRLLQTLFTSSVTDGSQALPSKSSPIHMLIVPHAGYAYSGKTAASAYHQLKQAKGLVDRVILLGPSHCMSFQGIALPNCAEFETPLGYVSVDQHGVTQALKFSNVNIQEAAHIQEHSLEVQLPFLQAVLESFVIVPLVVGSASAAEIQQVLETLWRPNTLIVVSTDLSHFLYSADAERVDDKTCQKILSLTTDICIEEACGHFPLNGALAFAKSKGWTAHEMTHCHSGSVTGELDKVVGYGSFTVVGKEHEH